jgi:hypothetical protein
VTFTGLKFNVTDTASNAASLLLDLQLGGTSLFKVTKAGGLQIPVNGTIGSTTAQSAITIYGGWLRIGATSGYGIQIGSGPLLYGQASAELTQRNGTNAQTFQVYRTWTDASNYQRLTSTWSTSTAVIHNEGAGTSADGSIAFNDAALATDTTKGFIMIPSCAGAPTGTPADIPTGQIPIVFDSTNNKLYVYDGGWIATAALS